MAEGLGRILFWKDFLVFKARWALATRNMFGRGGASQPSKDDKELEDSEIEDSCKDSRTREVKKDSSAYFGHMGHMSQHWIKV